MRRLTVQNGELPESIDCYGVTESTPDCNLVSFDPIAKSAVERCGAIYAGVHMINDQGYLVLASRLVLDDFVSTKRQHLPKELSRCYTALLCSESDFNVSHMPLGSPNPGTQVRHGTSSSSESIRT